MNRSNNDDTVINDPPANNTQHDAYPTAIGAIVAESTEQMAAPAAVAEPMTAGEPRGPVAVAHPVGGPLAPSPSPPIAFATREAGAVGEHVPRISADMVVSSPSERREEESTKRSRRTRYLWILFSLVATIVVLGLIPTLMDSTRDDRSHTDKSTQSPWDAELLPRDGGRGSFFGSAVAIHGHTAIVGASGDSDNGYFSGAAYVFAFRENEQTQQWIETAKLRSSDGAPYQVFGASVAIHDDIAVVGAPGVYGSGSGSVHVFVRDAATEDWAEETKLTAGDDSVDGDKFGFSVGIYNETVVVGATGLSICYVFVRSVADSNSTIIWKEEAKLLAADGSDVNDRFGWSVGIYGNTVVAGADLDEDDESTKGSAYIFARDEATSIWRQVAKLLPRDGVHHDRFGYSVAIHEDIAVVGALYYLDEDYVDDDIGSAFVYVKNMERGDWLLQAVLLKSDGIEYNYNSGCEVAVYNGTVVVGSSYHRSNGAVHVFTRENENGTWSEKPRLLPTNPVDGNNFGVDVGVYGSTVIVGARHDDVNGENSGSAYVYSISFSTQSAKGNNGLPSTDDVELDAAPSP